MSSIGPSRLDERQSANDVFILDVRPETEHLEDHIPGSYNAPVYDELRRGNRDALDSHLAAIPDDADVVTVCKAGIVARKATEYLTEEGYATTTLTGGYTGWRQYERDTVLYRFVSYLQRLVR